MQDVERDARLNGRNWRFEGIYKDHPCVGCYHWRGENYGALSCNYIFDVGHRRPCPPGAECTEKKIVPQSQRFQHRPKMD